MLGFLVEITIAITTFLSVATEFLVDQICNLVNLAIWLGKVLLQIPLVFSYWLPSSVVDLLLVAFGVVVTYKILGREG